MSDSPTVMKVRCPQCNKKLGFPTTSAGHKARCPGCHNTFRIELPPSSSDGPAPSHRAAVPAPAESDIISINCPSCSKRLRYPSSAIGRHARCSGCNDKFLVEDPADAPAPALAGVSDEPARSSRIEGDDDGLFNLLADAEASGEALAEQPDRPADFAPAEIRPVTSTSETRRMTARPAQDAGDEEGRGSIMERLYAAMGSLAIGCVLSAMGALIGAFIWFGIAKGTGYHIGYVAVGVGGLAGLGMQMGTRRESILAGVIAALFGMAGIFTGNMMYVAWVEMPRLQAEAKAIASTLEYQREQVVWAEAEKILLAKGLDPAETSDEQNEAAEAEAEKRVAKLSESEVRSRFTTLSQDPDYIAAQKLGASVGLLFLWASVSLGFKGVIFLIIGLVAAFRVGYGGFGD